VKGSLRKNVRALADVWMKWINFPFRFRLATSISCSIKLCITPVRGTLSSSGKLTLKYSFQSPSTVKIRYSIKFPSREYNTSILAFPPQKGRLSNRVKRKGKNEE
jgi:hypothetical protein